MDHIKKVTTRSFYILFAMLYFFINPAGADETPAKNYGDLGSTYLLNEYVRLDSTASVSRSMTVNELTICTEPGVTCSNFVPATATAEIICDGNLSENERRHIDGQGETGSIVSSGWSVAEVNGVAQVSGKCWQSVTVCNAGICTDYIGPDLTVDDVVLRRANYCAPTSEKNFCQYNYTGTKTIIDDTGDDMFRIDDETGVFFEYLNMGGDTLSYRLRWIARNGGEREYGLMIPSGPANTYTDYKQFTDHPPGDFLTVEKACYPVVVTLCQNAQPPVPYADGACGTAVTVAPGTYPTLASIPDAAFCSVGTPINKMENSTLITWVCTNNANISPLCVAHKPQDGVCGSASRAPLNRYSQISEIPNAAFCDVGTAAAQQNTPTGPTWLCNGMNGGAVSPQCKAENNEGPAVCGPANRGTYPDLASIPAGDLCAPGNAVGPRDDVAGITPNFWWSCTDINGSFPSVQCGATKGVEPPPPPPDEGCTPGETAEEAGPNDTTRYPCDKVADPYCQDTCDICPMSQPLICAEISPGAYDYVPSGPPVPAEGGCLRYDPC